MNMALSQPEALIGKIDPTIRWNFFLNPSTKEKNVLNKFLIFTYRKWETVTYDQSCPTGFKLCSMKLSPPPGCHPCGVWCAEIQPCPPKPKKKVSRYEPGKCTRPCCKHWKPVDGDCKYDDPCKAHCFNHPPGMKPKVLFLKIHNKNTLFDRLQWS